MIIHSLNVKGITDTQKSALVKRWIFENKKTDIFVLTEIKLAGKDLMFRLSNFSSRLKWFVTPHSQGSGGIAIGVNLSLFDKASDVTFQSNNQWIKIKFEKFYVVGIYASCLSSQRTQAWAELLDLDAPCIVIGDFNMTEHLSDRYLQKGSVIQGAELEKWQELKEHLGLIDVGTPGEFSWQNYATDSLHRKARLDRCYVSQSLRDELGDFECKTDISTCLSDHYPIKAHLCSTTSKSRAFWFHADASLFKIPMVKQEIKNI